MIRKSVLPNLELAKADLAFEQARTLPGAVVEMIEPDPGRFTVTVVWDDTGAVLENDELDAFERLPAAGEWSLASPAARGALPPLGVLSKRFESNGNPGAIGFDSTGGFSYGAYQIATKTGTLGRFLDFLGVAFKPFAAALQAAGGAAAGLAGSEAFKGAWRLLANSETGFADAQHEFIKVTHFDPFLVTLKARPGLDVASRSLALQNVAWSVAVQHGPANKVFANALAGKHPATMSDDDIIESVYEERSKLMRYFPRSTPRVREALAGRFEEEQRLALAMLGTVGSHQA